MVLCDLIQENVKLHSQLLAKTSVVEGLREERKLWGKELAHQGVLGKVGEGEKEGWREGISEGERGEGEGEGEEGLW